MLWVWSKKKTGNGATKCGSYQAEQGAVCVCVRTHTNRGGPLRGHARKEADPDGSVGGYRGRRETAHGMAAGGSQRTSKSTVEKLLFYVVCILPQLKLFIGCLASVWK